MMVVWQKRGKLYKLGFVGIIVGCVVFIISFCTPSWATYSDGDTKQHMGLWQTCTDDMSLCTLSVSSSNPGWFKAVRALECISMFFAVAAAVIGTYCNCIVKGRNSPDLFNKNMETSAIVSVMFGSFSLIIFASQADRYHSDMTGDVSWSFVLACVADSLLGLGALTMLVARRLQLMALQEYFAHRRFQESFHTDVQFPDYMASLGPDVVRDPESFVASPPAYDTVVNSGGGGGGHGEEEESPPPYSQVASLGPTQEALQQT